MKRACFSAAGGDVAIRVNVTKFLLPVSFLLIVPPTGAEASPCSYAISPAAISVDSTAGSGSLAMTAGKTCAWAATTTNGWLHTASTGVGNGTIDYSVDPNPSLSPRTGLLSAGSTTTLITQAGAPTPLDVALDNTNLVWETSAAYPWFGTNPPAPVFDGVSSAVSGNRSVPNSTSWVRTTLVGPGTLSFWWRIDSDVTPLPPATPYSFDALEVDINGVMQDQIMGQVDWNYRVYMLPPGTNIVTWQYVKDATYNAGMDQAWLDQVRYVTNSPIALAEALDTCGVTWTSGGNTNPTYWAGQTSVSHDGQSAAQSAAAAPSQQSWVLTSVSGVTNLSFWWKVSSQTNYDYLEFYTNSVLAARISGEVDWRSNFFRLPATTNQLKWRFVRTNIVIVAQGQSAAWLDQVVLTPSPRPHVVSYATNVVLNTGANDCQALLPDLTGPAYLSTGASCGSLMVTQLPVPGTPLSVGTTPVVVTVVDGLLNTTLITNNVVVVDAIPPVVTLLGNNPLTNECHAPFIDPGASVADNCSGLLALSTNNLVNPNAVGSYTIEYVATDANGNAGTNWRTVYVVDTQPPSITLNGPDPLLVECHSGFVDPGATASDDCAGSISVSISGVVDPNVPGVYTLVYTAMDPSANSASKSRTVQVVDTSAPLITQVVAPQTLAAGSNCTAVLPDLTSLLGAVDNCSPVVNRTQVPAAGTSLPLGDTNVVFLVDDGNGNTNSSSTRVTIADQTLPIITSQPQGQTNVVGGQAVLSVAAAACSPLSYQWYLGASPLPNETNAVLTLSSLKSTDAGSYYVLVASPVGSVPSLSVSLAVTNPVLIPPTMLSSQRLESGAFQISFSGPAGQTYRVLGSANPGLPMSDWAVLTNGTFTAEPEVFVDSETGLPARFYRIALP